MEQMKQVVREADVIDEVRKAAREQLKAGDDNIKLTATGGIGTPGVKLGSSQLTVINTVDKTFSNYIIVECNKSAKRRQISVKVNTGDNVFVVETYKKKKLIDICFYLLLMQMNLLILIYNLKLQIKNIIIYY